MRKRNHACLGYIRPTRITLALSFFTLISTLYIRRTGGKCIQQTQCLMKEKDISQGTATQSTSRELEAFLVSGHGEKVYLQDAPSPYVVEHVGTYFPLVVLSKKVSAEGTRGDVWNAQKVNCCDFICTNSRISSLQYRGRVILLPIDYLYKTYMTRYLS